MIKNPGKSSRRRLQLSVMRDVKPARQRVAPFQELVDGYYEADLQKKLTAANRSLCCITGAADVAELLDSGPTRFIDVETRHCLRDVFDRVLATGEAVPAVEFTLRRADGEQRQLELSVSLKRNPLGEPVGFHGIVRDISERSLALAALTQRSSQFALLQQVDVELNQTLALDSVLSVALNAAILLSRADAGFIGLIEHDRIRLARGTGGFPEVWLPLEKGIIARAIRNQRPELIMDVVSDPDYEPDLPNTCAEIAIPLVAHGRTVGVLNLETTAPDRFTSEAFEFTQLLCTRVASAIENARMYETLEAQLAELRSLYTQVSELEQLKTHMIRVAAHDLRSPLSIIASYIELLHEDLAPHYGDMDEKYVNAIRHAIVRMTQMTSDILSLERLHEHRDVTLMRVQLGGLLERTADEFAEQIFQGSYQLRVNAEPLAVYGDAVELHEAVTNLIGNAIKYTPSGGSIEVRLKRDGDSALVEVVDTGYGIPQDQQGQLFEPFHRVRTRETQAIEGTGLGLYLVRRIVERHGGTVHFQSEHGKGSTFGFRLPLAKGE